MDRKRDVLAFLKTEGSASLAQVAARLGLSKQGALRHLEALQDQGLVEVSREAHRGPGRPGHVYRLADAAEPLFPSGHRELAAQLVAFMGAGELERFFADRATRMGAEYSAQLAGLDGAGRVRALARLTSRQGHMTELLEGPGGTFQLRHCNCPIGDVATRTGHPCQQELDLYQRLLGTAVERTSWAGAGDPSCTYVIPPSRPEKTEMKKIG